MKKFLKYISIFSLACSVMSCESFIDGFEEDPNNPAGPAVDVNNMIQGVMLGDAIVHEGELARLAGMWSGHFTGSDRQYESLNQYLVTAGDFDSPWSSMYYATITQARIAKQKARAEFNPKIEGIAQILEAHTAGTAASLFGDVPYSEVLYEETPKFDPQRDVFNALQIVLDSAITNLRAGRGVMRAEKDIFFNGNSAAWINTAYTLKARYYLLTKQYDLAEAAAAQGISTPALDMKTPHGMIYGGNFNVWYSFTIYDRYGYITADEAYGPQLMDPDADVAYNRNNAKTDETARFNWFYQTDGGFYDLNYYSEGDGWGAQGFFGAETSFPMVTYAETQLILAEARARRGETLTALTALNNHRAALNEEFGAGSYLPLLITDFAPGAIENQRNETVQNAIIREILEERYVTFTGQIMPFIDIARTGNLIGVPVKGSASTVPLRFIYPQSEVNANPNIPSPLPGLYDATPINR
jgi:starch-binding outer membrane protein, SusD/RagB family